MASKEIEEYLKQFPKELRGIVRELLKHELEISDGFGYYSDDLVEALTEIARDILRASRTKR